MEKFAQTGGFCPNEACRDYGKLQADRQRNIIKFGKTRAGVQRYRCKTCKQTFTATTRTPSWQRTPKIDFETLALLAEESHQFPIGPGVQGHDPGWLRETAHAELSKRCCWRTSSSNAVNSVLWAT